MSSLVKNTETRSILSAYLCNEYVVDRQNTLRFQKDEKMIYTSQGRRTSKLLLTTYLRFFHLRLCLWAYLLTTFNVLASP